MHIAIIHNLLPLCYPKLSREHQRLQTVQLLIQNIINQREQVNMSKLNMVKCTETNVN